MDNNIYKIASDSYNVKKNVVKFNKNNKFIHEIAKAVICLEQLKNGNDFYTELIFKNNQRADVYIPKLDTAFEVVCTEKEKSLIKKKENYPCTVVPVSAKDTIKYLIKMLK